MQLCYNPSLNVTAKRRRIAIVWGCFGPYHLARLGAAAGLLGEKGFALHAIEVAREDRQYPWLPQCGPAPYGRTTLFGESAYGQLRPGEIAQAVNAALDEIAPSAVAAVGWSAAEGRAALGWCRRNGAASVLMSESKRDDAPRRWWVEWPKRRLVSAFDAALVGGRAQREYAARLGIAPERIFLGYDAVDNDYYLRRSDLLRRDAARRRAELGLPQRFFLSCCRLTAKKNLLRLISAYASYRRRAAEPWHLVICGSGELADKLRRHEARLGVEGIVWPGFVQVDRLPHYYALASAFILASTVEQWGLAVNEAMACGLPVLVSERVGCRYELVAHEENGLLFDPYCEEEIAQTMARLSSLSDSARERMGARSCEIVAAWGPRRFAEGLWDALRAGSAARSRRTPLLTRWASAIATHPLLAYRSGLR